AGADQVHSAANSLGERVGNTPMELMLVNLRLMGLIDRDLSKLKKYSDAVSLATHTVVPPNYPVVGRDAFRTATGVHAAAIIKAYRKNDVMLADSVYSGVPSHLFGLQQIIEIGPMSGRSNVTYWLEKREIPATDELVDRIFHAAKKSVKLFFLFGILLVMGTLTARAANPIDTLVQDKRVALAMSWLDKNLDWVTEQQIAITEIPAPEFHEGPRAAYVAKVLAACGLDVRTDSVGNVIGERNGSSGNS